MRRVDHVPHSNADAFACIVRGYQSELSLILSISYGKHHAEEIPHSVRAIIRLLKLRASGQLMEGQWRSLRSLQSHRDEYRAARGSTWQGVDASCQIIRLETGTDVDEDVLQELICSVWKSNDESDLISTAPHPFT